MAKEFISANSYCKQIFGCRVYKLALSAATTCPNRDGTLDTKGCIFCSAKGSGDFATNSQLPIFEQVQKAKQLIGKRGQGNKYIAYFQSFTGTYGNLSKLEKLYTEAIQQPDIVGLSIGTRPDCLGPQALEMLTRLKKQCPLWIELGLQTISEKTAQLINRCYNLSVYDKAIKDLQALGIHRITHVILGLPGESRKDMLDTVSYAGAQTDGIKLQLLHVLKGTKIAELYQQGKFQVFEPQEYYELIADALDILPENVVIHRLTGDGPKKDLIAPLWSADKKRVLVDLNRVLSKRGFLRGNG